MVKILVTGGAGFFGRYVVEELLKSARNKITILSRANKKCDSAERVDFIFADLRDRDKLFDVMGNFDTVYHLAGNVRTESTDTPELHYGINTQGTLNLLEACDDNGVKRFVYVSSCEVYGDKLKENILESEVKEPSNDYAKSKLLAEKHCKEFAERGGIKVTVVRPSYMYGYGMHGKRLFPCLIEYALFGKNATGRKLVVTAGGYDFVYVKDVAAGAVLLGQRSQSGNFEAYNISSGRHTEIKEIFEVVGLLTGWKYDKAPREAKTESSGRFSLSIEKARQKGYRLSYDLESGLADFLKYYEVS